MVGFLLTAIEPPLDSYALTMAPVSVISTCAGLAVVWNVVLAPCTLGEQLTQVRVGAATAIVLGTLSMGVFGPHAEVRYSTEQYLGLICGVAATLIGDFEAVDCSQAFLGIAKAEQNLARLDRYKKALQAASGMDAAQKEFLARSKSQQAEPTAQAEFLRSLELSLFEMLALDIESTVSAVAMLCLGDTSVTKEVRRSRARGLQKLGKVRFRFSACARLHHDTRNVC